jgi:hypothetical protein
MLTPNAFMATVATLAHFFLAAATKCWGMQATVDGREGLSERKTQRFEQLGIELSALNRCRQVLITPVPTQ